MTGTTPGGRSPAGRSWWWGAAAAVAHRPELWATAARVSARTVAPRWWARWPPLPRPPAAWMAFRMETAYGDPNARPGPEDVVAWIEWCREMEGERARRVRPALLPLRYRRRW